MFRPLTGAVLLLGAAMAQQGDPAGSLALS